MEIKGKIIKILPIESGVSNGKEWKKISFIIDTGEKYNNLIVFEIFGAEKVDNFQKYNKLDQEVEVSFNVDCKEWNEKWFTKLSAWKVFSDKTEKAPAPIKDKTDEMPF